MGKIRQIISKIIDRYIERSLQKQANKLQNYSFSGVTNTSQVGTAVPICYGRLFVGSSVISSGLDVDQEV